MPEGDAVRRVAHRLQPLVGSRVAASSPHPRGAATGVAATVDGRALEQVEAAGKELLLRFSGGVVLRSHLGLHGRWRVDPSGRPLAGRPWLVLDTGVWRAAQWHGPTLALEARRVRRLGPDVLAPGVPLDVLASAVRLAGARPLAEALLDQRVVAGLGTIWVSEALHAARLPPLVPAAEAAPERLRAALAWAREEMAGAVAGRRPARAVYRRAARPCPRCGHPVARVAVGDAARGIYHCPGCQNEDSPAAGRTS